MPILSGPIPDFGANLFRLERSDGELLNVLIIVDYPPVFFGWILMEVLLVYLLEFSFIRLRVIA